MTRAAGTERTQPALSHGQRTGLNPCSQLLLVRHPRPQSFPARYGFRSLRQHRLDGRPQRQRGLPRGSPASPPGSATGYGRARRRRGVERNLSTHRAPDQQRVLDGRSPAAQAQHAWGVVFGKPLCRPGTASVSTAVTEHQGWRRQPTAALTAMPSRPPAASAVRRRSPGKEAARARPPSGERPCSDRLRRSRNGDRAQPARGQSRDPPAQVRAAITSRAARSPSVAPPSMKPWKS